jgi:hypothetical protein
MPISFPNRASVAGTHISILHTLGGWYTPENKKKKKIENRLTFSARLRRKKNGARFKYGTLNGTLRRQNADRI